MNIDAEQVLENAIKKGLAEAVSKTFSSNYNNPIEPLIKDAVEGHKPDMMKLLNASINECIADEEFCELIKADVRKSLANILVQRFGGEIQKQVNSLKSDPTTRARIVMAIEEIVDSKI